MKNKIDLESTRSEFGGVKGLFEVLLRRFKFFMHIATMVPVYFLACLVLGVCLIPGITLFRWVSEMTLHQAFLIQNMAYGFTFAIGFFMYGLSMIFVAPALNFVIVRRLKEWRGSYYSAESLKWFVHNGLTYLVRFTFLEFVTPSPLVILFSANDILLRTYKDYEADGYIAKPFDITDFGNMINDYFKKRATVYTSVIA